MPYLFFLNFIWVIIIIITMHCARLVYLFLPYLIYFNISPLIDIILTHSVIMIYWYKDNVMWRTNYWSLSELLISSSGEYTVFWLTGCEGNSITKSLTHKKFTLSFVAYRILYVRRTRPNLDIYIYILCIVIF